MGVSGWRLTAGNCLARLATLVPGKRFKSKFKFEWSSRQGARVTFKCGVRELDASSGVTFYERGRSIERRGNV